MLVAAVCAVAFSSMAFAQEIQLATFQETAQILIDTEVTDTVTASVTLQSTSSQEIMVPVDLESKILDNAMISSIVVTNEQNCILGVVDDACILVNVKRSDDWEGIIETQEETKKIGDALIDDFNELFRMDAQYHSVYLHFKDDANVALETSGVVSGRGTVSATYVMPAESTDLFFERLSSILLPAQIRDAGGFFDVAKGLARDPDSRVSFSVIPQDSLAIYHLKVSSYHPGAGEMDPEISPLELLNVGEIYRSDYFADGLYPFNSLIQVIVVGDEHITYTEPRFLESVERDGVVAPLEINRAGWIQEEISDETRKIFFLFGDENSVKGDRLKVVLASGEMQPTEPVQPPEADISQYVIGIAVAVGAVGAAIFFLKGYKRG